MFLDVFLAVQCELLFVSYLQPNCWPQIMFPRAVVNLALFNCLYKAVT